jgi:hypothetical protein
MGFPSFLNRTLRFCSRNGEYFGKYREYASNVAQIKCGFKVDAPLQKRPYLLSSTSISFQPTHDGLWLVTTLMTRTFWSGASGLNSSTWLSYV